MEDSSILLNRDRNDWAKNRWFAINNWCPALPYVLYDLYWFSPEATTFGKAVNLAIIVMFLVCDLFFILKDSKASYGVDLSGRQFNFRNHVSGFLDLSAAMENVNPKIFTKPVQAARLHQCTECRSLDQRLYGTRPRQRPKLVFILVFTKSMENDDVGVIMKRAKPKSMELTIEIYGNLWN